MEEQAPAAPRLGESGGMGAYATSSFAVAATTFNSELPGWLDSSTMHILGVLLPENQLVKHALTHFYGIGQKTALRLCARVQIHDRARVRHLNQSQVTALTAFLSSPANSPPVSAQPLAAPSFTPPALGQPLPAPAEQQQQQPVDRLREIKIESDLRRQMRENIAHQRMIGSYVGRRHAMHLPVRGQNTQSNARTARKLNRVERYN